MQDFLESSVSFPGCICVSPSSFHFLYKLKNERLISHQKEECKTNSDHRTLLKFTTHCCDHTRWPVAHRRPAPYFAVEGNPQPTEARRGAARRGADCVGAASLYPYPYPYPYLPRADHDGLPKTAKYGAGRPPGRNRWKCV